MSRPSIARIYDYWLGGRTKYTASSSWNHPREVIRGFFAGTELVAPGLTDAGDWLPGAPESAPQPKSVRVIAGVGIKP